MIEYIYFVKCPNCEDEHFYFFNEAKDFAMSCIDSKPIITQTEVNRNDFGECTDSCDLGTVWSWEEAIGKTNDKPAVSVFTRDDLKNLPTESDHESDPEFDNLDNSVDFDTVDDAIDFLVKDEEEAIASYKKVKDTIETFDFKNKEEVFETIDHIKAEEEEHIKELEALLADDSVYEAYAENPRERMYNKREDGAEFDEETGDWVLIDYDKNGEPSNKLAVPEDMTIEDLVEAMEENESDVECKSCGELVSKERCYKDPTLGWVCESCNKASGTLAEDFNKDETVEFIYDSLNVTLHGNKRDVDDWDEAEESVRHSYYKRKEDVATDIWENFIEESDVVDVPGGLEQLEDDAEWEAFLVTHFDDLLDKYYDKLLAYYKDDACTEYEETHSLGECKQKPFLEEFDDAETHKASLTDCPECGATSYDMKEQYCTNCGFNL